MNKDTIQLATNETIIQIMKESRRKDEIIKKMFTTVVIAFTLMFISLVGGAVYFLNTFEVEAETSSVVIEGEDAQYNEINNQGDNNNISVGGAE